MGKNLVLGGAADGRAAGVALESPARNRARGVTIESFRT